MVSMVQTRQEHLHLAKSMIRIMFPLVEWKDSGAQLIAHAEKEVVELVCLRLDEFKSTMKDIEYFTIPSKLHPGLEFIAVNVDHLNLLCGFELERF